MKIKFLLFFWVLLLIFGCTPTKNTSTKSPQLDTLEGMLTNFEKSVVTKNWDMALKSMDADYKKEQHDEFFKGNTVAFFNDFFCGDVLEKGRGFKCLETDRIKSIKRVEVREQNDNQEVIYHITGTEGMVIQGIWTIRKHPDTKQFGIVGAVG